MIDPIGIKASVGDLRAQSVKADAEVASVAKVAGANASTARQTVSLGASEAAKSMAASPPVDADRVATIKKAVQEGKFPIYPATIADRLIAFEQGYRYQ